MTVRLKKTDVAIVGLGAVGGVAALPLHVRGSKSPESVSAISVYFVE